MSYFYVKHGDSMLPSDPNAPWWATEADYPDPGVVEYLRQVGSVMGGYSREELSVYLVQRDAEPMQMSVAGVRICPIEADLLCQVLRSAMLLMATDDLGKSPGFFSRVLPSHRRRG